MRIAAILSCLLATACGHTADERADLSVRGSSEPAATLTPTATEPTPEPSVDESRTGSGEAPTAELASQAPFTPGRCELGERVEVGASQARRPSLALDIDVRGGLLAFSADDAHVTLQPLDAGAQPTGDPVTIEMPGAMDLRQVHRIGDLHLLVTHTFCPDTPPHQALKCLFFRSFDASGHAAGALFQHQTGEWTGGPSEVSGDALVMLRSHTYMPPVLERYHLAPDGTITREQLGDLSHGIARGEDEPAHGAALAVDGDRIAALVRVGSEPSAWFLHFADGHVVSVRGRRLPEEISPAYLGFSGVDTLQMTFVRDQRLFEATLWTDGTITRAPTRVADSTPPPSPIYFRLTQPHGAADFGLMNGNERWIDEPVSVEAARELRAAGDNGVYAIASIDNGPQPRTVRVQPAHCVAH